MKRNKGFTLVELLVVMAIIAILASIVVPNVQRYIVRARVTKAIAEISGMDMSLTAIVTDAGRGNMGQMLLQDAAQSTLINWPISDADPNVFTPQLFENAALVYSQVAYDLLRLGRDCLRAEMKLDAVADDLIDPQVLSKLGTNYMDIALDPWGGAYRVWPGPWKYSRVGAAAVGVGRWPIPFRIFSVETGSTSFAVQKDNFILQDVTTEGTPAYNFVQAVAADADTWPPTASYPADGNKSVFIWSYGQNSASSQMLYQGYYEPADPFTWFNTNSSEDVAGGDDINSWDSGASWQRFYM